MHRKIFYFLLFLVLCPVLVNAGTKGRIKGKVVDLQTGEALIGANVVVVGSSAGANTDVNGEYLIQNLEAGVYTIKASYVGYQTISISNIRVNADLTAYQDIQLPSVDIEIKTQTIIAQRPLIQKDNTNAVRITNSDDIAALPIRNVTNIIGLTSGVVVQNGLIFIRGGRSDEVGYYLEGMSSRNPLSNQNAVRISSDAIEEIQVQSGGYTAEFGNSNAGIIRQQLKSGGSKFKASLEWITDNIGFKSKANAFDGKQTLGAYTWGNNEMSGVISGPITDRLNVFFNLNYQYQRDPNPGRWPGGNIGKIYDIKNTKSDTLQNFVYPAGPQKGNQFQAYTYTGSLNYDLKPIMIRLTGTYSSSTQDVGAVVPSGIRGYMNSRLGEADNSNGSFTLKLTHVINANIFYEISAGYYLRTGEQYDKALGSNFWFYGDRAANLAAGWVMPIAPVDIANPTLIPSAFLNDTPPRSLNILGWLFPQDGALTTNYSKSNQTSLSFSGSLSMILGKYNSLKVGGEYQQYTLRNYSPGANTNLIKTLNNRLNANTLNWSVADIERDILRNNGINNYGYDVLGNLYDGDGFDAPRQPTFASAYIQDKIEFEDLIINFGLRYDYIDINNLVLKDMANPDAAVIPGTTNYNIDAFEKTATFSAFSPRIGFSFPVTTTSMFHAQYGKFVQQPQLSTSYEGYYSFMQRIVSGGNYYPTVTGPNIRPTTTTQYELGFTQQVTDNISFDITGFYRDIRDQVEYIRQDVKAGSLYGPAYFILGNGDYATTKGFEIAFNMRRYQRLQINASLSFQDAEGTGSTPNAKSGLVFQPLDGSTIYAPKNIAPLVMTRPLFGNVVFDYRWGNNDGGAVLQNLGVSAIVTFNTGHPFTKGVGNASAESDARNRNPIESLNASLTPSELQVDLKIDKTFRFGDKLGLNVYLAVINLFDATNVDNVFLKTGTATDDGVLSDPKLSAQLIQTYGQSYLDMYKLIMLDYGQGWGGQGLGGTLYGPPRQYRLGIRLEY